MNTDGYMLDPAWHREQERLETLAALSDPLTRGHLLELGVRAGWCCAEVGAGTGTIAWWLSERVGDTGRVVVTDIDTRFLDGLVQSPNIEVRHHDIVAEPLEAGRYDLIHTRYLLIHLPERERTIAHLVDALRPGGWLLVEDGDFCNYQQSYPPVSALTTTGTAIVRLLERAGADPRYGLKVFSALAHGGLITRGISATQRILPCGSHQITVFTLVLAHLQHALIAAELTTAEEVEAAIQILQTPSPTAVYGPILVSVWGQRPSD